MQPLDPLVYDAVLQFQEGYGPVQQVAQPMPQIIEKRSTIKTTRRRNALTDF